MSYIKSTLKGPSYAGGITWGGLQEFRALLKNLPRHLRDQARDIVDTATRTTHAQVYAAYPIGPGRYGGALRRGLVIDEQTSDAGVFNAVISKSPHAHLWEFGTKDRRTEDNWKRGRVKPARERGIDGLIPTAIRNRKIMEQALIQMMTNEGFIVSGSSDAF